MGLNNPVVEGALQAVELEAWQKMIADPIYTAKTLYQRFKSGAKTYPTANITARPNTAGSLSQRPAFNVPMRIQSGAAITQGTGNGDSMGRGSGSFWVTGDIAPVFLFSGCEITYLAEMSTAGKNRALFAVRAQELKNSLDVFMRGIEALFQGDSSGELDQIPSTATVSNNSGSGNQTSFISGMNNANQFQDQQIVQVFPSEGGASRGTATISFVDGVSNTLYFSTVLPSTGGATAVGDFLMVQGCSGAVGGSIAGFKTYNVNGNSGSVLGIPRATYPSRLSTPTINLSGNALNPAVPYRLEIQIQRALGPEAEELESMFWYVPPDQQLAWNNLTQNVKVVNQQEIKGDRELDLVKKYMPDTIGGREMVVGYNATPGRLDLISTSTWGIVELKEPSLYDFSNGVTVMPVVDTATGGYLTSKIFYYNCCINLFNSNMRAAGFVTNAAIPTI
jgi:hypothetical protein